MQIYRRIPHDAKLICVAWVLIMGVCPNAGAVSLHLLPVGDPGNAVDPRPGANLGAVAYRYSLDKYDVSNAQYVEFLNAKAVVGDPFALFDARMSTQANGGVTRSAAAPYTYAVKAGMENKPVVYVSWFDAIRFTNWLTNGEANGDTEVGSYFISAGGANAGTVSVPSAAQRAAWVGNSLHYLLPTADEWYKAAYYKGGGTNAGYWSYPSSRGQPIRSSAPGGPALTDNGNVAGPGGFAVPGPVQLTDVGAYNNPSPYGQFDMGGNVVQFTDSNYEFDPSLVVLRGTPFGASSAATFFQSSSSYYDRSLAIFDIGFRIAMVPEPGTLTLAALAALGLLAAGLRSARRRRNSGGETRAVR